MKKMEFELNNKGIIKIDVSAINKMNDYKQDNNYKTEAGGILIGRLIKDSKNIIIDKITVPMIQDKRTRFSFVRSNIIHQKVLNEEWKKSNGTMNYLGEWHTHPENNPTPSNFDINQWKRKLKEIDYCGRYLYFIIVGLQDIRMWEGDRRTLKINRLYLK